MDALLVKVDDVMKFHCDMMRAIRKMESAWERVNGSKFALVDYHHKSGFYALILSSQLPQAKAFKRWVTYVSENLR